MYLDTRTLTNTKGNAKLVEKSVTFNGSFFAVPLKNFSDFEVELNIDPTKLQSIDANELQE